MQYQPGWVELNISPHPNADRLEIAQVGLYTVCVKKGKFAYGGVGFYIPVNYEIPVELVTKWGYVDKNGDSLMGGPNRNVIRSKVIRGVLSEGILLTYDEVKDLEESGGTKKYKAEIPPELSGLVYNTSTYLNFDIEDFYLYPDVIKKEERIQITEKLHGVMACVCVLPEPDDSGKDIFISSKGLLGDGLAFDLDQADNKFTQCLLPQLDKFAEMGHRMRAIRPELELEYFGKSLDLHKPIFFLGELTGPGVQKKYRYQDNLMFRLFDITTGNTGYFDTETFTFWKNTFAFNSVPLLDVCPFDKEYLLTLSQGPSIISEHRKEGVVVKPVKERRDPQLGRVILKAVSPEFRTRKGDSDYS